MDERLVLLLAVLVSLAAVPTPVAADETRTGGTIIIEAGETVDDDLTAFSGTVIVRGTINGDLTAFTGNVFVDGEVNGNLEAFAGNVRINGTVTGDASAFGGNIFLEEGARVGGQLDARGGNVVVEGDVGGDAQLGASTITIGESAVIGGSLTYDGQLDRAEGAQIAGEVRQDSSLGADEQFGGPLVPNWAGWLYGFLVNLVLGAVVLLVFPRFSKDLADQTTSAPLLSGVVGLLAFVGIPILAILLFISLVGIPLGLIAILVFPILLWFGYVYGAFSVGAWLLSQTDTESRWLALLAGLLLVSLVGFVPIVGGLVQFLVLLLGLGALALSLRDRYRGRRRARTETGAGGPEAAS